MKRIAQRLAILTARRRMRKQLAERTPTERANRVHRRAECARTKCPPVTNADANGRGTATMHPTPRFLWRDDRRRNDELLRPAVRLSRGNGGAAAHIHPGAVGIKRRSAREHRTHRRDRNYIGRRKRPADVQQRERQPGGRTVDRQQSVSVLFQRAHSCQPQWRRSRTARQAVEAGPRLGDRDRIGFRRAGLLFPVSERNLAQHAPSQALTAVRISPP